jgi:OOP family OmpA-OmpF porin
MLTSQARGLLACATPERAWRYNLKNRWQPSYEGGLMKHVGRSLLLGTIASLVLAIAPAHAQLQFGRMDTGLYLGGSVGGSKFHDQCDGAAGAISCDDKDTAWKAFVGYQFTKYIGAEVGYVDLGKAEASAPGIVASFKARGVELVGVASYPFNEQFSVFAKAGALFSKTKLNTNVGINASDNNTDFTFGLGARYNLTRNFGVRAEWQRYQNVGGGDAGSDDIDFYGISLLYSFY